MGRFVLFNAFPTSGRIIENVGALGGKGKACLDLLVEGNAHGAQIARFVAIAFGQFQAVNVPRRTLDITPRHPPGSLPSASTDGTSSG